jgi:ribokinase
VAEVPPGAGGGSHGLRPISDLRFVVVGAYVVDCFVNTARLPAWGQTYEARSIRTSPGGKALNQAVALARLGAQVTAVGVVGEDGLGRDVLAVLERERVDVQWVEARADTATTVCLCFVGDDGESAIVWHIDDEVAVRTENVRAAEPAFERADAVLMTFELPVLTMRETISSAQRWSARVIVQPAPMLADPAAVASLQWDDVDVLVPNEIEARALLNGANLTAELLAGELSRRLRVPAVVVTLGASGCVVHADGVSRLYPAPPAVPVDTTGASDAFTAAYAAGLVAGAPPADAIGAAQSAAALAIGHPGGHESMPSSY